MYKLESFWDFSGCSVVKTLAFHCMGAQVQSLVGELGSHMLCGTDQNKKEEEVKRSNLYKASLYLLSLLSIFLWKEVKASDKFEPILHAAISFSECL